MTKAYKELPALVKKAKQLGFQVRGGTNGGGWFRLATACGYSGEMPINKTTARAFLRKTLDYSPPSTGAKVDIKPAIAALEAKLAAGNNWGSAPPAYKPKIQPPVQSIKTPSQRSPKTKFRIDPNSPEFLESYEWRSLRMEVLTKYGPVCMCCGATRHDGEKIHVDHIKPRRKRPDLALIFDNLQVLCGTCNHGKGNWSETDFRPKPSDSQQEDFDSKAHAHLRLIAKPSPLGQL